MPRIEPSNLGGWYAAYAGGLVLYARQMVGAVAAEDAVQEAFVQLMGQAQVPANVKAWLYKTVRNAALSGVRSAKRRDRREREAGGARPEWFVGRAEDVIDAGAAQEAMETLPIELREVVVMRIWGQASFAEMAEVTGRPLSTVYDLYRQGLAGIRQKMEAICAKSRTR